MLFTKDEEPRRYAIMTREPSTLIPQQHKARLTATAKIAAIVREWRANKQRTITCQPQDNVPYP